MDKSTRRLGSGEIPAPSPSTINEQVNLIPSQTTGLDAVATRPVDRSLGTHNLPLGTNQRNPSSPFPPETGKRTLETGPSYER